jgi:hypothetical protein
VTDISNNRNAFGGKLRYDFGDMPEYLNGENAQSIHRAIAKAFYNGNPDAPSKLIYNEKTGTYERISRARDINPKQVAAWMGLLPRDVSDLASLIIDTTELLKSDGSLKDKAKGAVDIALKDTPLNRIYKEPDKNMYRLGKYMEMKKIADMFNEAESNYKKQIKGGNLDAARELAKLRTNEVKLGYYKNAWNNMMNVYKKVSVYQMARDRGMTERSFKQAFPNLPYESYDQASKEITSQMCKFLNIYKTSVQDAKNNKDDKKE